MRCIFALALAVFLLPLSCKGTRSSDAENSDVLATGTKKTKLLPPSPGLENQPMVGKQAVIDYMKAYRKRFYEDKNFLFVADSLKQAAEAADKAAGKPPGTTKPGPGMEDVTRCLGNDRVNWSPLVRSFYCLHLSYQLVVPNMRGCFSQLAGGVSVNGRGWYPEIFDFCTYQDYDAVTNGGKTKFDLATLIKNKDAGKRVGVMGYLTPQEEEVFKYVLWTWYNPFVYSVKDQQDVLDAFWGPGKYDVAALMKTKQHHPEYDEILEFMKAVEKNGGEVPWPGSKGANGKIIPVPPPPPPLKPHEICAGGNDNGFFVQINEPETAKVTFAYRLKTQPPTVPQNWHPYGATFDKVRARWQGAWSKTNTTYDLQWMVDGKETITDITQALKRKCP